MRILVVGSGGREHALVWKIAQSKLVDKIFCAPGNGGIASSAECLEIKADDVAGLLDFARKVKIDLTVVGPEASLANGIVDEFRNYKLRVFGPEKQAARIESSKVFAKELMLKYKIPTAASRIFDNADEAVKYIENRDSPCVVKADGLAAGKGVVVAKDTTEAVQAVKSMMQDKVFGAAGNRIIVEECLEGQEASILVLTDSKTVVPLSASQDHKRVFDLDQGPNTGGMGAYSPAPVVSSALFAEILDTIVYPAIDGLDREGINYQGVLYAGVMLTKSGPKALEFNARFGDPETQAIIPLIKSDLVEVMLACAEGKLSRAKALDWDRRACVCVVCASQGYPGDYGKGEEISGLEAAGKIADLVVFHSGTKKVTQSGKPVFLTNGGRVLGVTGLGKTVQEAIAKAYQGVEKINFKGMHYRRDIGQKALEVK